MKIAFLSSGSAKHEDYAVGDLLGIEYQIFGLARAFVNRGHDSCIIRRWYNERKEETVDGVKIINISSPDLGSILKGVGSIVLFSKYATKRIKTIEPDVINLTWTYSAYHPSKIDIPKVFITHNIPYDLSPIQKRDYLLPLKKKVETSVMRHSDIIISLNKEIKRYLEGRGFRTVFIPNGVEIEKYTPNYSEENYIYFNGRIVMQKGLRYLIKAYSMLDSKIQDQFKLVVGGSGPLKGHLESLSSKYNIKDSVNFLSWLSKSDFVKKINNCTIFVLPSLFECMPVTLLEAMASGKSVIASDIPGPKDIITHGYDGFLFEKENVEELKKYLELLLGDKELRKRTGKNARKTIEEKYTFEKVADSYLKLYEELLSGGHRNDGWE